MGLRNVGRRVYGKWRARRVRLATERRAQPVTVLGDPPGPPPRRRWAYLAVFIISSTIVSTWFRAGTFISTGDMGAFIRRGWTPEMAWSWNHQVSGAGSAAHTIGRAFEFGLIELVGFFGFDETVAQWLFYTCIYGGVGLGVAFATAALVRNNVAVVMAGSYAVMSGFFLTRLPNPLNIISVATVAFMTGLALRAAQGRRVPTPLAGVAFLPAAFLAFNPPMFVVAGAWAAVGTQLLALTLVGWAGVRRLAIWQILGGPWVLLLNAWWMVPFIQAYTGGGGAEANATFTDPTNWSWSQVNNTIPNILTMVANWAWYKPQYLPFAAQLDEPWWIWARYMLPVVVFLAPLVALRRRRRTAFTGLALVGLFVFLAKGLKEPLSEINMWLYLNMPMFWLFREPMSKLGQVLVTLYAIAIALFVEGMIERVRAAMALRAEERAKSAALANAPPRGWQKWRPKITGNLAPIGGVLGAAAVLLAIIYPHPLATGKVIPDERPLQPAAHVRVPEFWRDMAETIDSDPRPGRTLVLPLDDYYMMPTTWGFFGVDSIANLLIQHPVITPKPDGYFGDTPGFKSNTFAVETALLTGDFAAVPALLDSIGASDVIVRHDLIRGLPQRSFADSEVLSAAMAKVPGMTLEVDGPLQLWKVGTGESPTVRQYNDLLSVGYKPEAASAVIGSMGTGITTLAQQKPKGSTPTVAATIDTSPSVTNDTIAWQVPAVDAGPATTPVTVTEPGVFRVTQRSRAAPVLVPSVDAAASQLVLTDPTSVAVDGQTVSSRPPLLLPVPQTDIVAVQAGTRTVSLDEWGIPPGTRNSARSVAVGSATDVTAYAPAPVPAKITPPSDVYDCNNYEPRPTAELQLTKGPLPEGDGEGIRLSAMDHAACTRLVVTNPVPGQVIRVRLEYRQVEGKRPQICVWQVGVEGCERAPRAALANEWTPYEQFTTVDDLAEQVQIILHADVGERLVGRTTTDYRNVTIEALAPVMTTTAYPTEVPPTSVSLAAGDHVVSVEGGPAGDILEEFEPLQDCFRYDDASIDEAQLAAEISADPNNPTFALMAKDHMACLGATAANMGASSLYELSMEARSVKLRNPKICLFLKGPDLCAKLPVAGPWDGWTPYEVFVKPDPATVETRLYLYGLRDLEGEEQSRVEYRDVKLRPVASPVTVTLIRAPNDDLAALDAPRAYEPEWKRNNPASFSVNSTSGPGVLALAETFAPGWTLSKAETDHIAVEGWMNAWRVGAEGVTGTFIYQPSMISRKALMITPITVVLALLFTASSILWTRHLRRQGNDPNYHYVSIWRRSWQVIIGMYRRIFRRRKQVAT